MSISVVVIFITDSTRYSFTMPLMLSFIAPCRWLGWFDWSGQTGWTSWRIHAEDCCTSTQQKSPLFIRILNREWISGWVVLILNCWFLSRQNILIDGSNTAKITDFGFALELPAVQDNGRSLYTTRAFARSEGYYPGELTSGKYSPKSDVYSYGVVSFLANYTQQYHDQSKLL